MTDLADFRADTRSWLAAHCPAEMRGPADPDRDVCWGGRRWVFRSAAQRDWLRAMAARGWTVPTWPVAYGGGGLDAERAAILREEMARIAARAPLENFGIAMLGPALLRFGSEAQKQAHLPPIARGEIRWCQGFSEPEAGSDLASLRTRAQDAGEHFVVNGQKIWTSYADQADWIFALVRTDPAAKKQLGISFLLADMATPGITTRPIQLISGKSPFCETFFDDVVVPRGNLVGTLNRGWDVAKYLLTHEREAIGRGASGLFDLASLDGFGRIARWSAPAPAPLRQADIARADIDGRAYALTVRRYRDEGERDGTPLGERSAVLKFLGADLNKRHAELMAELADVDGLDPAAPEGLAARWLRAKGNSIEGGTSEIMLDIIARTILALPQS